MNRVRIAVFSLVLALASLGCGLIDRVAGGETAFTNASELWSDVPRMEGLTPSEMEMPLYVKLLMRTAMSQILAGGTGGADWIVFSTDKTSEDVQGFYTNERMAQNGWIASENSTCLSGSEQGMPQVGLFCVFLKQTEDRQTGLMVIASPNEEAKNTTVVFIRVENQATPGPSQ